MGLFGGYNKKEYENIILEKNKQLEILTNEISSLRDIISKKEDDYKSVINKLDSFIKENILLKKEILELENNVKIIKNDVEKKNDSISELKDKKSILESEKNDLRNTIAIQKNTIDDLNINIDRIKNEQKKILDVEKEKRNKLEKYIQEKEEQIKKVEEQVGEKEEYDSLKSKRFKLGPGKYKGGTNIPYGEYNLKILFGYGMVETNKPDEVYFWMSDNSSDRKKYGYAEKYNGLCIGEKTTLKISDNAEIEFSIRNEYNFQNELDSIRSDYENKKRELEQEYVEKHSGYCEAYNKIQSEISTIKSEMKILNNEAIEKYYVLSDYDGITSQDCKNELVLLKSEEKRLRDSDIDIMITNESEKKKLLDRSIRQIIRNFNSDCDNQILNIRIKNIDVVRNRIQKSYDTLNKLYSTDGVALSREILELKLKQATLLYTYELKYQQEKDIQQAIKEQMLEEAKTEREIQEQKKKIEKDLQQHLGEVNRLMKYLQKSQVDAERQLYMDKIKELEDKIKVLELNKETVLEREANAKAGFVYIISNIGSFGEDIYKIGMTRRLEPMDRVKELSSASVPFEFDVHAMIFSSDAPELETLLHQHFSDRAVNKINPRKEFYHVGIDEIEQIVKENYNDTVQFTKIPLATEYRQSLELYESADFCT